MRTYVRVERGHDPARGRRLVLRVRRAAGRSEAPWPAGDRRRLGRARGELRGEGGGRADGDERRRGAAPLSRRDRRAAADARLLGGEQGDVRRLRRRIAARRAALDRRGVSRRARDAADRGIAGGDRGAPAAATCASASACRSRSGWRGRSSWRRWRAASRSPTGCSSSSPTASSTFSIRSRSSGSGASGRPRPASCTRCGCSTVGDVAGLSEETLVALLGRASGRQLYALSRNHDARRVRAGRRRGSIGAQRALGRSSTVARGARRHARGARRPHHPPDAGGRAGRANRRPAASLRRLLAGDAQSHAAAPDGADARDSRDGARAPRGGAARRSRRRA